MENTTNEDMTPFDAGRYIESLLGDDDGTMLAQMALYRSSILAVLGREGILELVRTIIDEAKYVQYYSRRSRREMDSRRIIANLRIDYTEALKNKAYVERFINGIKTEKDIDDFLVYVLRDEVIRKIGAKVAAALEPHWKKAKAVISEIAAQAEDEEKAKQLLNQPIFMSSISGILIGQRDSGDPNNFLVSLSVMI